MHANLGQNQAQTHAALGNRLVLSLFLFAQLFAFIAADVAEQLVPIFTGNVIDRVREQLGFHVTVDADAHQTLIKGALAELEFGGRGVRNAVESMFTNPLARALFERNTEHEAVRLTQLMRSEDGWTAVLE